MQSQSMILLAEIRHNEFQAEAARHRIVNQACALRPTANGVVAGARGRVRIALANAAAGPRVQAYVQRVLAAARGNGSPAVPRPSVDSLSMEL